MGQDEEGFEMSGYTEIALLQYELEKLRAELAALKAENETAWAQARCLAFQLQKTPLSSANGGILG